MIDSIKQHSWTSRWAQPTTFLSCDYWALQYFDSVKRTIGENIDNVIFISRKGHATCFMRKDSLDKFGRFTANLTQNDPDHALLILHTAKKNFDQLKDVMDQLWGKIPTKEEYKRFHNVFDRHLGYQVFIKKPLEYLEPELLVEFMPAFTDARVYTEEVYKITEKFLPSFLVEIASKEGYNPETITCLTKEELENYFETGSLPDKEILAERYEGSIIISENGKKTIVTGPMVNEIETMLTAKKEVIQGNIAYSGRVSGRVRLIYDITENLEFNTGEILVTKMTDPQFLPLMRKSAAIVTDAGGILCHAAIVARELKKPCIIGTEVATKMLKDGDFVEVDANTGIVRKIE
jgi:phosphohistidine swiveling domain-containing protein